MIAASGLDSNSLAQAVDDAEAAGRFDEAHRLLAELVQADPNHPKSLLLQGQRTLQRGDARGALSLFRQAEAADPQDIAVKLQLAMAQKVLGDLHGALRSLDEALAIQPYLVMGLLSKGAILEKLGQPQLAAQSYRYGLQAAPEDHSRLPAGLKGALQRAKAFVEEHDDGLEAYLRAAIEETRQRSSNADLGRFDECLDVLVGKKKVFVQQPDLIHFPRLPAIQFYDRSHFPWLPELEAATDTVRHEMLTVLAEDQEEFKPYIAFDSDKPVNQWAELNHSPAWSSFFLWKDGRKIEEHCARCPRTAELLDRIPMLDMTGYGPTAMFSVLQPKTRIPPHTGSANTRLVCHLPLILPPDCGFRVGNDTREWRMGEAWVFDDTIEHEAWNDSDQVRVILIIDLWNPFLTEAERKLVDAMMVAHGRYMSGQG
jgi:aspartyl/asparaginyl beta-hydroxylase (cupin superfamily)